MSSTKKILFPYPIFDAESIGTNKTSAETNVAYYDYGLIDLSWTGSSPVGVVNMEFLKISADKNVTNKIDVWETINFTGAIGGADIAISGASGTHQIQLNKMPSTKIRLKYVYGSGSGNLTAIISAKET